MSLQLFTIGHGTASEERLAELIADAGFELLVDVRSKPGSRRHPQFAREALQRWIPQRTGSAYVWDAALGGFRPVRPGSPNVALRHPSFRAYADYMETPEFGQALSELIARAASARTVIMCSETLWWRCHRRLISDAATLRHGADVRHLMHDGKFEPHIVTAGVRLTEEGTLRYDVMFTQ